MSHKPVILAFDTSASACGITITHKKQVLYERFEPMNKGQVEQLFPLLECGLRATSMDWQDIDAIGVCSGPGNFTGIRIGISAARGLALSLGVPSIGVTRLEAMALDCNGSMIAIIDARRKQIYRQKFENNSAKDSPKITDLPPPNTPNVLIIPTDPTIHYFHKTTPPVHSISTAIALYTYARFEAVQPRPAPLYLRQADASISQNTPLTIQP